MHRDVVHVIGSVTKQSNHPHWNECQWVRSSARSKSINTTWLATGCFIMPRHPDLFGNNNNELLYTVEWHYLFIYLIICCHLISDGHTVHSAGLPVRSLGQSRTILPITAEDEHSYEDWYSRPCSYYQLFSDFVFVTSLIDPSCLSRVWWWRTRLGSPEVHNADVHVTPAW